MVDSPQEVSEFPTRRSEFLRSTDSVTWRGQSSPKEPKTPNYNNERSEGAYGTETLVGLRRYARDEKNQIT